MIKKCLNFEHFSFLLKNAYIFKIFLVLLWEKVKTNKHKYLKKHFELLIIKKIKYFNNNNCNEFKYNKPPINNLYIGSSEIV